jgi:hypothetical protein
MMGVTLEANEELGLPVDSREYGIGAQVRPKLSLSLLPTFVHRVPFFFLRNSAYIGNLWHMG